MAALALITTLFVPLGGLTIYHISSSSVFGLLADGTINAGVIAMPA
jgi:hypothetical protein